MDFNREDSADAGVRSSEAIGELYNDYFRTRFAFDPRRDPVWKEVVRWIQNRFIPPQSRVLDLGAGYCNFINNVTAGERHAVDVFSDCPKYAAPGVQTHLRSATDLSFLPENSFDVAFASNLVEHLTRAELILLLRGLRRVLREGGRLILLQPNFKYCSGSYFDDYTHIQIFTEVSLLDFLEAHHFKVIRSEPRFLPVNMKSTLRLNLPMLPLIVRLYLALPFRPLGAQMLMVAENLKDG